MKKHNTVKQSPKRAAAREAGPITIGMDLGDKTSCYYVLGGDGEVVSEGNHQEGYDAEVWGDGPLPDRDGSRNPFALGEPLAEPAGL